MTIQGYPEELDYVNAQLHGRGPDDISFLGTFCLACLRADAENYEDLRCALHIFMMRYPASAERLKMERADRGAEESEKNV